MVMSLVALPLLACASFAIRSPCSKTDVQIARAVTIPTHSGVRRVACVPRGRACTPMASLFGNLFGTPEPPPADSGKFMRHKDLAPGCAPLGIVCAGLTDDQLEAVANAVESVWSGADAEGEEQIQHVPIAALGQADLRPWVKLRDVLAELEQRDSVLPDRGAQVRIPLILLSGFNTVQTSLTVRILSALNLIGGTFSTRPMFAAAVPRSLDKSLRLLCDELEGDHVANKKG
uniref:Uncharacterized protein n=1 Tax=Coccolithus braarudii TaxID=221442 RepID=A0A7S0Q258_9EUKA|mmetsp:Transcript_39400/g.83953  ORF Transcript_39400/g.83953 Transcript_39400/m.83953 type:complete len:232 (+) Transcript_39400:1-696(+)